MQEKVQRLCEVIKKYDRVAVCLSGGSDSSLVAIAAVKALGRENVVGVTVNTSFLTGEELDQSAKLCRLLGIEHMAPRAFLLNDDRILKNDEKRCYYCKQSIAKAVWEAAREKRIRVLLDGSSVREDGIDAAGERKLRDTIVVSPLIKADIHKKEIAEMLKFLGMRQFVRPENACLATRIALGEPITVKKLRWIRAAENYIRNLGFDLVRVRVQDGDARVEVEKEMVPKLMEMSEDVIQELMGMGYKNVVIDPQGYKNSRCGINVQ